MNCSRLFRVCCLSAALFSACACSVQPQKSLQEDYQEGLLLTRELTNNYGERNSSEEQEYLGYLRERLSNALPASHHGFLNYQLILLDTNQPMAYSPGGGFVLISKGLVKSFSCEAELAFVVAHEMAHQHLGHTLTLPDARAAAEYPPAYEAEADRFGVGLVAAAGYDPRFAPIAIAKAYLRAGMPEGGGLYAPSADRMAEVRTLVTRSGWQPPGTVDRRAFQLFRMKLGE